MITTNLWGAIAAILAVALCVIWWPYFRNTKLQTSEVNNRSQANTQSYHQSLAKLEQQLEQQQISEAEFNSLKTELARKLIQDEATQDKQLAQGKRTIVWPLFASVLTIGLSIPMYLSLGASEQLIAANDPSHFDSTPRQKMEAALVTMEQGVADNPENTQLLFQLAHSYLSVGKFDKAIASFKQLVELEGEHAEFLGPQAQALYYKNQQVMTPEIEALTTRALALDPQNTDTLILLGMDNFVSTKYVEAITYWQRALNSKRPGIDREAITAAIEEAKGRLALTGEALPELPTLAPSAGITFNVSVSDSLSGQYDNEQTVFIYAIAAQGPRMPLAAVKITASELPKQVTLNDAMAMTPAAKISQHETVQLFAIISQTGSAGIKSGDLRGHIAEAKLNEDKPYTLVIDTIVE